MRATSREAEPVTRPMKQWRISSSPPRRDDPTPCSRQSSMPSPAKKAAMSSHCATMVWRLTPHKFAICWKVTVGRTSSMTSAATSRSARSV